MKSPCFLPLFVILYTIVQCEFCVAFNMYHEPRRITYIRSDPVSSSSSTSPIYFGFSLDATSSRLIVGAPLASKPGVGNETGLVYECVNLASANVDCHEIDLNQPVRVRVSRRKAILSPYGLRLMMNTPTSHNVDL